MRLAAPQMLWLLIILVLPLSGFLWWSWRRRQQLITQFISSRLINQLKVGVSASRQKARLVIIVTTVIFLVLALAQPQWGVTREEARQRGLDIIVAVDTSNSMLAQDVSPSRLARAKLAALDLMRKARTDRLGLIAFAGAAFLQCPLTLDDAAFSQSLDALDTGTVSPGGTAIGEAISEARKVFKKEADSHKVLILFTDGEDHDTDAVVEAEKAAKEGIIIFTVGVGTPEGELLRVHDEHGRLDYIRDDEGKPVKSKLDEDLLKDIARVTKGMYLPLRGAGMLDTLYDGGIAPLPKSEGSTKIFERYTERFQWPLGVALGLLVLEIFLPDRKRRRSTRGSAVVMEGSKTNAPSLAETVSVIVLLLVVAASSAQGSPSSAMREYKEGKFQDALKDYNQLLENKKDDPRLHFNAGAAAYQSRQLDEAQKEFNEALLSPDLQLQQRAYYNLGNTLYRLGQQIPDAEKKQEAWQNAIKSYESASKLNQQDPDSKFNKQFVEKQLEELKKQQQQQQQQNQQQNKNQKQNQDRNQQNQQNQNQQQNQSQQDQNQSKKDQESQNGNKAHEKSEEQKREEQRQNEQSQAGQKKEPQQQKPDQQQGNGEPNDKSSEEAQREAAMMAAGQMTPNQAKQLLDSDKDEEKVFQLAPPNKNSSQTRAYKNW